MSSVLRRRVVLLFTAFVFSLALNVAAQTDDRVAGLQTRIDALQRELQQLQLRASEANSAPRTAETVTLTAVVDRINELSTALKILARQVELDKEQAAERAKTSPIVAAGRNGFSVQSADGAFRLRLRGYVHSDGHFFLDDGEQRGVDTFVLRRVRPIVEATMFGMFDVRVMPDFGVGTTVLQDAYVEARLRPQVKIRAGKFKPPVGLERLVSATELPFIERALPTALVPNRDVGLMVHGDIVGGNLAYALGVFNGVADGGSGDADIEDGKEVAARLFAQPFRSRRDSLWQGLGFGVSATYGGQRAASATSTGLPLFRTAGQTSFFAFRGDDPVLGPVLANGTRTRVSVQGHYYAGPFGILGEQVRSSQEVRRSTATAQLDADAWQVQGSWVLTGETPSYRGVTPRAPFDMKAGTWGAFEVVARYTALHVDRDAFPVFANQASAARGAEEWTGGLNWILSNAMKLQVNFEHTRFEPAGAARRRAENGLLTRVQFSF